MKIKAVRGTKDILPKDSRVWAVIEKESKRLCRNAGFEEIRTPLLEEAMLFTRSIGESSDIVRKEMYSFLDRKKRLLCLRPEATASVVRAYLEHGLDKSLGLAKFYYFGPMFRAERPQAGRLRQFHHLGVEAIGCLNPYLDAEAIALAIDILNQLKVTGFSLKINSIGCQKDRQKYIGNLKQQLKSKLSFLCQDCRSRYKINPLRIFDCKNLDCRKIVDSLPGIDEDLCSECSRHYAQVKSALECLAIAYVPTPHLVRGLDYYTKTCFEIVHPRLGAQDAIGAGGRYDNLVKELGGPQRPAVGFALGIERIIAVLESANIQLTNQAQPLLYLAAIGEEARREAFKKLRSLRQRGIWCEMDYLDKSLKGQMRLADKSGFKYAAILGEEELKKGTVILRDMQNKLQREIKLEQLDGELK